MALRGECSDSGRHHNKQVKANTVSQKGTNTSGAERKRKKEEEE